MEIIDSPSPNFNDRRLAEGAGPDMLILHYTDTKTAFEALSLLQSEEKQVSAHYLVDEDGTIYQLVAEDKRAWHAGVSYWDGETDINSRSIGIEIQNPGHGNGYRKFPEKQMQAVAALCKEILFRHDIPPHRVLGHSDIAPDRKRDPGELFDWKFLAKHGIGLWPDVTEDDRTHGGEFLKEMAAFSYNTGLPRDVLEDAFAQHFIRDDTKSENPAALLAALNRAKADTGGRTIPKRTENTARRRPPKV